MDILNKLNNSDNRNKALWERAMLSIEKYPSFIESALPYFATIFNQSQLRHFAEYFTELIVSENKTITGINDHFLNHIDQSAKNHFLTDSNCDDTKRTAKRLDLILEQCRIKRITDGLLLVIDKTLTHKTGEQIEAVDWSWDHPNHFYTLGHQLVSSQFVAKDFHVSIDSRLYRKEEDIGKEHFKSKLDLAVELIDQAVKTHISFTRVAGGSWYFCDKIINHLSRLHKDWTIDTILSCYAQRWPIETFYKDAKQNLGFELCEMRRIRGIHRHWNLVFLAYKLLEFESLSGILNKWIKSNVVTICGKCHMVSSEIVRSFIFWTYQHLNQGVDPDSVFSKTFQNSKQLKFAL